MTKNDSSKCGARTRSGKPCQKSPLANGRCELHGGKSVPSGPGHHSYKHGKHSKLKIPDHLQERIREELTDENLLNLREDIATIRVRAKEVLSSLGELADLESLKSMMKRVRQIESALDQNDVESARSSVQEMKSLLKRSMDHERSWSQFERLTERRRRLVATERDQTLKAGQLITVNQAVLLMDRLVSVVVEHVTDPQAVEEMRREFAMLVGPASGPSPSNE